MIKTIADLHLSQKLVQNHLLYRSYFGTLTSVPERVLRRIIADI